MIQSPPLLLYRVILIRIPTADNRITSM